MVSLTQWINDRIKGKNKPESMECYLCTNCNKESMTAQEYFDKLPKLEHGDRSGWYIYYDESYKKWDYNSSAGMNMEIHGVKYVSHVDAINFCYIFNNRKKNKK